MSEFDYFKAFLDVDLGKTEMIAELVGKIEASVYQGLMEKLDNEELSKELLLRTINIIIREILTMSASKPDGS